MGASNYIYCVIFLQLQLTNFTGKMEKIISLLYQSPPISISEEGSLLIYGELYDMR